MKNYLQYKNYTRPNPNGMMLYVDMNSFFASCEQQDRPELRGKPVGVCGSGKNSVIIAPSIEAKQMGVKTGMRLFEAKELCPQIIGVPPNSATYRYYHKGVMDVLRKYSEDVIPKSIDEAVVNLTAYKFIYPDKIKLAQQIKQDINTEVGDWLKCSIGIAPNTFYAKLATDLQKPDGLVEITSENADSILSKLKLEDLCGIGSRWAARLSRAGIKNPLLLKHTSPELLKKIMGGIIGYYWHYRLNFAEVDYYTDSYKSMSAERTLSAAQRQNIKTVEDIILSLCMKLEGRMVQHHYFCKYISFNCRYQNGSSWDTHLRLQHPLQDGTDIFHQLYKQIKQYENESKRSVLNSELRKIGVGVNELIPDSLVQYELFDDNLRRDRLRRIVYDVKERYGKEKIIKAVELRESEVVQDIIGFGSIKDMY